jgi:predicted RNA methylase
MEDKKDFLFRFINLDKRKKLKLDDEALYSVTDQYTADRISRDIQKRLPDIQTITDATACVGGNTFSFSKFFKQVHAIELDYTRYQYLLHNMDVLEVNNVTCYHGDLMMESQKMVNEIIFIDPPWGGPEYKIKDNIDLYLSDVELSEVCDHIKHSTKYIALKVPVNFNEFGFIEKTPFLRMIYRNPDLRKMHLLIFQVVG